MNRSVSPARAELVYVQSRGWLLGKLGIAVLVLAAAVLVWGPLVAGRPNAMLAVGWWRTAPAYRQRVVVPASLAIACVALYWTIERL